MDEHLFRSVSNPARRRRLLLQHAARVAQEIATAALLQTEADRRTGADPDPIVLNRARELRQVIQAAAEIDDVKPRPTAL
jgi:hypothetical protein